jgi:hypothetical protein
MTTNQITAKLPVAALPAAPLTRTIGPAVRPLESHDGFLNAMGFAIRVVVAVGVLLFLADLVRLFHG